MKVKNLLYLLSVCGITFTVLFLMWSFFYDSMNPSSWYIEGRGSILVVFVFACFIEAIFIIE